MFLRQRSTQAEYFDAERPRHELEEFYRALRRVNRLFWLPRPFQRALPVLLGESACRSVSFLDLGAGDGWLAGTLTRWAGDRGWNWHGVNLDLSHQALSLNQAGVNVAGSVLALPFQAESFDLVIASQMTHHLSDEGAEQHLREAWRVARRVCFISDLHRNAALYGLLWMAFRLTRLPRHCCQDGLLSVRRGWRLAELRKLAGRAGIPQPKVKLYFGARVLVYGVKEEPMR